MTRSPSLSDRGQETLSTLIAMANLRPTQTERIVKLLDDARRSETIGHRLTVEADRRDYLTIASYLRLEASALPMIAA